ncbi:MAG: prepilin peptidase [Candidatus Omnitrophica bacterium]|nr:prepilin peptidase [Candidatus Omnitrophota bacterium]HOX54349.1 prepilin peptidase [Candidatus Omnitrophota bacterium]
MQILISIFVFIVGAFIGSFLNVCIYRMPREMSIKKPARSFCPNCKKTIPWYDNIPLVSFILLKRHCRFCGAKISWRYPLVELITAFSFLILLKYLGFGWPLFVYAIFISFLIVAIFTDLDFRIIPDEISVGGLFTGILLSAIFPFMHGTAVYKISVLRSFLGILVAGGVLYLFAVVGDFLFFKVGDFISQKLFKKEIYLKQEFEEGEEPSTMGGGDIKLLAMIGAFMGWQQAILSLFLACILGGLIGIIVKIKTKGSLIPFGPFIAMGAIISFFFSKQLIVGFYSLFYL